MSDQQDPTQTGELGPLPTPRVEPAEDGPGGPDAAPMPPEVVAADPDPAKNPATDTSPEPVRQSLEQGEDTQTEATRSDGGSTDAPDGGAGETPA